MSFLEIQAAWLAIGNKLLKVKIALAFESISCRLISSEIK